MICEGHVGYREVLYVTFLYLGSIWEEWVGKKGTAECVEYVCSAVKKKETADCVEKWMCALQSKKRKPQSAQRKKCAEVAEKKRGLYCDNFIPQRAQRFFHAKFAKVFTAEVAEKKNKRCLYYRQFYPAKALSLQP